jgi:hypothetical protein
VPQSVVQRVGLQMAELWWLGFIIGGSIGLALSMLYSWRIDVHYQNGYWAGRSSGWKSANEHYEKIRKLRAETVFDYDKN